MSKKNGKSVLEVLVEFGGVSIGDNTARVGLKIARESIDLLKADEVFCGHRLKGKIVLGNRDDSPGQTRIMKDLDFELAGIFDCKRIGCSPKQITTGLAFSLSDIDIADLAKFSKGAGKLVVETVEALPDPHDDDDEDEEEQTGHTPGTLTSEGPWRAVALDLLFNGALLKNLKAAGLDTVGALADYSASEKRLTDIAGVGEAAAQKIEDRLLDFWADNPQVEQEDAQPVGA